MRNIQALVVFAFVSSVTPGPNNVLLWASGLRFGFRATVPQVVGTSIGIHALAAAVAAGIGLAVTAVPGVELAFKVVGSAYLLFLAYQIAGSEGLRSAQIARPLRLRQAVAFQSLNPKAWLFGLAAMSTFRPDTLPIALGSTLVAAVTMVVVVPTAAIWAAGGTALQRLTSNASAHRAVGITLAVLLAATIAFI